MSSKAADSASSYGWGGRRGSGSNTSGEPGAVVTGTVASVAVLSGVPRAGRLGGADCGSTDWRPVHAANITTATATAAVTGRRAPTTAEDTSRASDSPGSSRLIPSH